MELIVLRPIQIVLLKRLLLDFVAMLKRLSLVLRIKTFLQQVIQLNRRLLG